MSSFDSALAEAHTARLVWGVYVDGQDFMSAEGGTLSGMSRSGLDYEPREDVAWCIVVQLSRMGDSVQVTAALRSTSAGDAAVDVRPSFETWSASSALLLGELTLPRPLSKGADGVY